MRNFTIKVPFVLLLGLAGGSIQAQNLQKNNSICDRSVFQQEISLYERSLDKPQISFAIWGTQRRLETCGISLPSLGYSEKHLDRLEQRSRLATFERESKAFYERRSTINPEELAQLGAAAGQRPDRLLRQYNEFNLRKKNECQPVDLRPQMPPVRDQDTIGWCYAFVAADLASFHIGKAISAIDMAVAHNETRRSRPKVSWLPSLGHVDLPEVDARESTIEYGNVKRTIDQANTRGYCLEADAPSDDALYSDLRGGLERAEQIAASNPQSILAPPPQVRDTQEGLVTVSYQEPPSAMSRFLEESSSLFACEEQPGHPFLSTLNVFEFDAILKESDASNIVRNSIERACRNRISAQVDITIVGEKFTDAIHAQLSQERPSSFTYSEQVLLGGTLDPNGGHDSLIVGRRWNEKNQTCDLLVRNSWGSTCEPYTFPCEDGHIWVPDRELMKATVKVQYVQK
jgi:hypothetical protein